MHFLRVSVLLLFACMTLTGCEHWHNMVNSVKEGGDRAQQNNATYQNPYAGYASDYSNPYVEVYNLDGTPQQQMQQQQPAYNNGSEPIGRPAEGSPNVTIYSVDDEWGQRSAPARPGLVPPAQYRQDMPSPFNEGALTDPSSAKTIYFAHGSSYIDNEGQRVIRDVADEYRSSAYGLVNVVGHASKRAETHDPVQRSIVNMKMSMKRALKVSESLIRKGVPADSIKTTAAGDTSPANNAGGKSQEAANRRVEVKTAASRTPRLDTTERLPESRTMPRTQSYPAYREFPAGGPVTLLPLN